MRTSSFPVILLFSLFWCGLVGFFLGITLYQMVLQVNAQHRFKEGQGRVLESRIVSSRGRKSTHYSPFVRFEYSVAGISYRSDRYSFNTWSTSSGREEAQRVVQEYVPGKTVRVFYDPDRPEVAILSREISPQSWFMLLFLQPFTVFGLGLLWGLVTFFPARRRLGRFLESPPDLPWEIPSWGVVTSEEGVFRIDYRPSRLGRIGAVYFLTSFLSIVILALGGRGFNPPLWSVALGAAGAALLAVVAGLRWSRSDRRSLRLDPRASTLSVGGAKREQVIEFSGIENFRVRWEVQEGRRGRRQAWAVLAAGLRGSREIVLHEFISTDQSLAVARKAGAWAASIVGVPIVEDPVAAIAG